MGVHGLWKLLEAAGKPVPLESLENKVLAVDVSIWLHQLMKGYQDSHGAPLPNAHLLGLFHRVCKLLFYKIKPVFVFDGGVPLLKRQTIAARKNQKKQASQNAAEAREKLLKNLVKRKAVRQMLQEPKAKASSDVQIGNQTTEDMFHLPPLPNEECSSESDIDCKEICPIILENSEFESDSEPETKPHSQLKLDLHSLDVNSEEFLSLPPDVRHDILSDLKETRKQNSWGRLHEMPEESGEFSSYQLGRLLKRRNVQCAMEKAEKEMGGKVLRINELQELMEAQGVNIIEDSQLMESATQRIASDSTTRFVLCKDSPTEASSPQKLKSGVKNPDFEALCDEQDDFIAQMAENMLQQIEKKQQEISKSINKNEDQKEGLSEEAKPSADGDKLSSTCSVSKQIILADNWSSDDDSEGNNTSQSLKSDFIHKNNEETGNHILDFYEEPTASKQSSNDFLHCGKSKKIDSESDISGVTHQKSAEGVSMPVKVIDGASFNSESILPSQHIVSLTSSPEGDHSLLQNHISDLGDINRENEKIKVAHRETTVGKQEESFEIVIRPSDYKDEDDLFADIFKTNLKQLSDPSKGENAKHCTGPMEVLEKVMKPETLDFDGIFQSDSKHETITVTEKKTSDPALPVPVKKVSGAKCDIASPSKKFEIQNEQVLVEKTNSNEESGNVVQNILDKNVPTHEEVQLQSKSGGVTSAFSNLPQSPSEWKAMEASLEHEQQDLQLESGRQERLAASITDQMCVEAQELLQLFGLPYIVAPMEAEAQCAFLDAISLTEGSITDDSDIWLFGGKKVYKNFFNQKKHVLQYTSSNINHYFKLSREQLVQLALLVGSDYTTGIQGIGPVTALEIVAAFYDRDESDPIQCALRGLSEFRDWWNSGRPHKSNRLRVLGKKIKNVKFSEGFPSQAVVEAYMRPSVEESEETFSWGSLDLTALREYTRSKFGWTASKTDEILLPVAKRWTARTSQRSIDSYFNLQPHLVEGLGKMSKRVQKAVTLMGMNDDDSDVDDPEHQPNEHAKKKTEKRRPSTADTRRKIKRPKPSAASSSSSDSENEGKKSLPQSSGQQRKHSELPVRAPTIPRNRTSTGVKRIGVKPKHPETNLNAKITAQPALLSRKLTSEEAVKHGGKSGRKLMEENNRAGFDTEKDDNSHPALVGTALSKKTKECTEKDSLMTARITDEANRHSSVRDKEKPSLSSRLVTTASSSSVVDRLSEEQDPHSTGSGIGSFTCHSGGHCDALTVESELAALSDITWEDDPWIGDSHQAAAASSADKRPKLYFGGIRPNKRSKPRQRPAVALPTPESGSGSDTRGVRPGWLTHQRLESRTAWVDLHKKREEKIPQREQDQRAMEEAKMKAIAVIKASEAKQASRLLGRSSSSNRGRGKKRPARKILPEHNLSESSSDED